MRNNNPLWLAEYILAKPNCWVWEDTQRHLRDGKNVAWKRQKLTCNGQSTVEVDGGIFPVKKKFRTVVGKITEKKILLWTWEVLEWIPVSVQEVFVGLTVENGQAFKTYRRIGTDQAGNEYQLTENICHNRFEGDRGWVEIIKEEERELQATERDGFIVRIIKEIGWDAEGNEYLLNERIWRIRKIVEDAEEGVECGYCGWIRYNPFECEHCSSG